MKKATSIPFLEVKETSDPVEEFLHEVKKIRIPTEIDREGAEFAVFTLWVCDFQTVAYAISTVQ